MSLFSSSSFFDEELNIDIENLNIEMENINIVINIDIEAKM